MAIGVAAASELSYQRGHINIQERDKILSTLESFQLPVKAKISSAPDVLAVTKLDKKMESGKVKFILLRKPGKAFIDKTISDEELLHAISFVIA